MDNLLRRAEFISTVPSIRRAKARYKRDGDLTAFESEVEQALAAQATCTVCGQTSIAQDGRCSDHIGTSLTGDWPTESDIQAIQRMRSI